MIRSGEVVDLVDLSGRSAHPFGAFVLLVSWRQPALRVVLFCSEVGGLTLA